MRSPSSPEKQRERLQRDVISSSVLSSILATAANDRDDKESEEEGNARRGYFCSELVAAFLKNVLVLPRNSQPSSFWPGSFSMNKELDWDCHAQGKYGDEILLEFRVLDIGKASVNYEDVPKPSIISMDRRSITHALNERDTVRGTFTSSEEDSGEDEEEEEEGEEEGRRIESVIKICTKIQEKDNDRERVAERRELSPSTISPKEGTEQVVEALTVLQKPAATFQPTFF